MKRNTEPFGMVILTVLVVVPLGTAVSGLLTWLMFENIYGGLAFLALFVVGIAAETLLQRRIRTVRARAGAAAGNYIARLHDAAREAGVELDADQAGQRRLPDSGGYRSA